MDKAVIQIRISQELKDQSMLVAENLGFTTSTLIKLFLSHVVATREIPFIIKEIPNPKTAQILDKALSELKSGDMRNTCSFKTPKESIPFLEKIIQSPKDANSRLSQKLHKRSQKSSSKNKGAVPRPPHHIPKRSNASNSQ